MAEPFNVEQFRQQMSGQAPQGQQPQMQPHPVSAQVYQAQPAPVAQPQPYQSQSQIPQMQPQQMPPQHVQSGQGQAPQPWTPPVQPHHMQNSTHIQQRPAFNQPAHSNVRPAEEVHPEKKTSKFSLKRLPKVKTPKVKKSKNINAESAHTTKTSPAMIFMFGMASGIVCFLVGSMLMSSLLADTSAKNFRDIERQNAAAQQPVLPAQSLAEIKAVAEASKPE